MSDKRLTALFIIISSHLYSGYGQNRNEYKGTILSSDTTLLLNDITIINLSGNTHTLSDANGDFMLDYRLGDTIEFRHDHWETKLIYGDRLSDSTFLNRRAIALEEIVITKNRPVTKLVDLKTIEKEKNKKGGIYYGGRPPIALLNPFGGKPITFFYELFSKSGRRARKMERNLKAAVEDDKIDRVFNMRTIRKVISIEEDEIADFMAKYRPTIDQTQTWNTYDLYLYLQKSYESFKEQKEIP